ncbi:MAG: transporter [Opitutia bacterium]|nr:sodium:solute symporter family protein [Opitutaceae bacterium]PHX72019.1 MAG: transporter [Opitutae bacterium]
MKFFGLHWIDVSIIVAYIITVLVIGKIFSHGVKGEKDFFLGGRSLGRWLQFFLSFGNMTDPGQATTTASSVYRQGAGGAWLALITLFLTPYYWFMNVWFRRVRLTTMADLFSDRFGSRFLATLYAVTMLMIAVVGVIAGGNVMALKTLQPLMVKDPVTYTVAEQTMVKEYHEFIELRTQRQSGELATIQEARYSTLRDYYQRGALQPYVTYLNPAIFYLVSTSLVAVFIMLGGLKASAVVDAVQAILVVLISVILIPFGLWRLGGPTALHEKVPDVMFNLFGGDIASEYTWYSICALLLVQLIGIAGSQANMTISGSAKDEMAARLGAVTGGFSKRFVTIAWAYCGLIAFALFGPGLPDPDQAWGLLTRELLPVGLIGIMITGILGGKIAVLGAQSVVLSGLLVKNLYEPLLPGRSDGHYMVVARLAVPALLGAGVIVGLFLNSVIVILKFMIVLLLVWGVPITVLFLWRRVTQTAVVVQVFATILLIAVIPAVVPLMPSLARSEMLTQLTRERMVTVPAIATAADVTAGRAAKAGDSFMKTRRIEPVSLFFEEGVVRVDPRDPASPKTGKGLFRTEVFLLKTLGVDVADFNSAQLLTTRYLVDALIPISLIFGVSLLTRRTEPDRVARFYARMKTPVASTPELDTEAVAASYANPSRFDHFKLFPKTDLEFTKWNRMDAGGFAVCCVLVGVVIFVFKGAMAIGG